MVATRPGTVLTTEKRDAMDGYYGGEKPSERSRWTPLTRMLLSGEMTQEKQQDLTTREKFDRWMINEGFRRVYVFLFIPSKSSNDRQLTH